MLSANTDMYLRFQLQNTVQQIAKMIKKFIISTLVRVIASIYVFSYLIVITCVRFMNSGKLIEVVS